MQKKYLICLGFFLSACTNPHFQPIAGKAGPDVRTIKGEPVSMIKSKGHEMWTYKQGDCVQRVFFDDSGAATDWHETGNCQIEE